MTAPAPQATDLDGEQIATLLDRLASEIREDTDLDLRNCLIFGLETGGLWLAQELQQRLQLPSETGSINVHFYRDDFSRIGLHPSVGASHVPEPIDDRHIIMVDDVLYTGRTLRAAMNELFDYGRPASIRLAVLIDRGGRELPIQADYVGYRWRVPARQNLDLRGPKPLSLKVLEAST